MHSPRSLQGEEVLARGREGNPYNTNPVPMPGIQAPFPKAQLSVGLGQMATLRLGNLISPAGSALSLGSPLHRYPALGLRPLTQMRKVIQGEAQHLGDLASIELPFKVGGGGASQDFFKEGGLFRMCINFRVRAASTG